MEHPIFMAAMVLGPLGSLFCLIGMATPYWITYSFAHAGLFVLCVQECVSYEPDGTTKAAAAFLVIGFLGTVAASVVTIYYFIKFLKAGVANRTLPMIAAAIFFVAAGLNVLGYILLIADKPSGGDMGYSGPLSIVGTIFCGTAGALLMVHRSKIAA